MKHKKIGLSCALALSLASPWAWSAEADAAEEVGVPEPMIADAGIEEMVVVARQKQSATDVVNERITQPVAMDLLSASQISRVGDSTVAAALQRVPGLTVVNNQFVYVRGLGERYSSSQLNGASVPSPDLTRDVLPLDIFPATILDSLQVQKAYSPDAPAAFGGGNVNIRTRALPNEPVLGIAIGSGINWDSSGRGFSYAGGGDDSIGEDDGTRGLPGELRTAINQFQGDISPESLFGKIRRDGQQHTFAEAEALNRQLATSLNRNVDFKRQSLDPDLSGEISAGGNYYFGTNEDFEVGALLVGAYDSQWRNRERITRTVVNPDTENSQSKRTIHQVTATGIANLGVSYLDDHEIATTSMFLRDTEDEATLTTANTFNFARIDGRQLRDYYIRYEQRELRLNQIRGSHTLGAQTREQLDFLPDFLLPAWLEGSKAEWYFSKAKAETDIPGETLISAEDAIDPTTGELLQTAIRPSGSAADFRFSDLSDDVESYGTDFSHNLHLGRWEVGLGGGWDYSRKGRGFTQTRLGLGTTLAGGSEVLIGTPGEVFSDDNILDPNNRFEVTLGGIGTESYLAGQTVNGNYFKFDVLYDTAWRVAGGVRWEQFQQLSVPINPLEFDPKVGQVATQVPLESLVFRQDDYYPSLALTYSQADFWAEEFQLRFGWSQTVARPDIREISESTFIDPVSEARVRGNSNLKASELTNLDIRAEWFFASGDNFTLSLFYKDIADPIETVQRAGSDQNLALGFINADSGEIYGAEIEFLKDLAPLNELGFLGGFWSGFFVAGNVTLSDSEIKIGDQALDLTNPVRSMHQASDWVGNVQLGYDSPDGIHSLSLAYNVFGERIFFAGRNGGPDAFEQPFHSLDLSYGFFPTDEIKVKLKLKNLLDESLSIERAGVTTLEQTYGLSGSLELSWSL